MTVLVTGASGMLGALVARRLVARGEQVRVFQRRPAPVVGAEQVLGDLTDPVAVHAAVEGTRAVVHLGAKVSLAGSWSQFADVNIGGTRNLIRAIQAAGAQRLVHVSSPSVAHHGRPLLGADAHPADPQRARGHYSRSKAVGEQLALAADGPDLAVVVVRPHLVWGPGDTQLVGRIVERAGRGQLAVIGSGAALIDTLYVDNAADAIVAALDRAPQAHGQAVVVTNGEPRPVADLISSLCAAAGVPAPRRHVAFRAAWLAGSGVELLWPALRRDDEPPVTRFLAEQLATAHWFDQRRTRALLDWAPAVSLDTGFARLRQWYAQV